MNDNGIVNALTLGSIALSTVAGGVATTGLLANCICEAQYEVPFSQVKSSPLWLNSIKNPETYLSNNGTIDVDALSLLFSQVRAEASKYVKQHLDLLSILSNACQHIKEYFPNTPLKLIGDFDEEGLIIGVLIGICTTFGYEESLKRLGELDNDWIVPNISKLDKVLIDLEF